MFFFSFIELSKLDHYKKKKCQKRKSSQGVHFWGANTPDLHQQIISVLWQWHPEKRVEYQVDPLKCSLLFLKEVLQFPGKMFKLNYRTRAIITHSFYFFQPTFWRPFSLIYILNNAQAIIFDTLKIQFITKEVKGYHWEWRIILNVDYHGFGLKRVQILNHGKVQGAKMNSNQQSKLLR